MSRPVTKLAVAATAVLVAKGPVKVRSVAFHNNAAAATHVQFFNAADPTDVTVGTTLADWAPAAHQATEFSEGGLDLIFGKGLVIAATTTPDGNTPPSAALLAVNLGIDDG